MAKINTKQREELVVSLRASRTTMNSWMTLLFRVAVAVGAAALGVALWFVCCDQTAKAIELAGVSGLGFSGAMKLGMDMTRCELQFHRIETAITAGMMRHAIEGVASVACFSALEKFSDEIRKTYERDSDSDRSDP
jgi:hypothetical protein